MEAEAPAQEEAIREPEILHERDVAGAAEATVAPVPDVATSADAGPAAVEPGEGPIALGAGHGGGDEPDPRAFD